MSRAREFIKTFIHIFNSLNYCSLVHFYCKYFVHSFKSIFLLFYLVFIMLLFYLLQKKYLLVTYINRHRATKPLGMGK